jgi:hypothetical protein
VIILCFLTHGYSTKEHGKGHHGLHLKCWVLAEKAVLQSCISNIYVRYGTMGGHHSSLHMELSFAKIAGRYNMLSGLLPSCFPLN